VRDAGAARPSRVSDLGGPVRGAGDP